MTYDRATARPRWTVEEVKEFCGWETLEKIIGSLASGRNQALFATCMLTGSRISEVLMLKKKHFLFDYDEKYVIARTIPRMKCYKKIGGQMKWKCDGHCKMRWNEEPTNMGQHTIVKYHGWKTEPVEEFRTFPFPKNEPLAPLFEKYLQELETPETPLFNIGYHSVYHIFVDAGKKHDIWMPPHWFRAQRASQLAFEYGFNSDDLMDFFKWRSHEMALHYASKGYKGLAAKMVRT